MKRQLGLLWLLFLPWAFGQRGEGQEYFKRWLERDVLYIIAPDEKSVFEKLTTNEEKLSFIEQFWRRRDSTSETAINEFKEEHYRRIAYANDHFTSGFPGWKTDRGMLYIKFGPPDEIIRHPSGGQYIRESYEGGGQTATYPFEQWRYRYIEGVGSDVELEFVDKSLSGEYKLAKNADEKDAMLNIPNAGLTQAEAYGMANRRDRILRRTNPAYQTELGHYERVKDAPFQKLQTLVDLQRAPAVKFPDLRSVVTTKVHYSALPYQVDAHSFRVTNELFMVPVTIEVPNKSLVFVGKNNLHQAELKIYGELRAPSGRIPAVFEDSIVLELSQDEFRREISRNSVYQKKLFLPSGRYNLSTVIKDEGSESLGTQQTLIVVTKLTEALAVSAPLLAQRIEILSDTVGDDTLAGPFTFAGYKVFPNIKKELKTGQDLIVYSQVYNFALDPTTTQPQVEVTFKVLDGKGEMVAFASRPDRMSLGNNYVGVLKSIPRLGLPPGRYSLEIEIKDKISGTSTRAEESFLITP